ncbi:hybrid sensor histidine kinase/response regulator transcription factor [Dyadobacter sp. CY312]|uniref:hybrid sensor histidine kinase/response regulator transcription factor n=1 Tax=Dyadobacter sp. CY312 TaxID=2907303 RepID=UPI001F41D1FC|nr:hybrid sensor histidine kinase/response regulator transcription factor [Dyadobacter sp. CY312]MCE7040103.1 ATP-binding protein [Dyadobacter sp. CY312]
MKILTLLLLLACVRLQAQIPLFNSQVHYKVDDGLPQSYVSSIIQDVDGFVWFGTLGGLARYDGKNFLYFLPNAADSNSVLSSVIVSVREGPGKNFFIGYENWDREIFDPLGQRVVSRDVIRWLKSEKLRLEMTDRHGRLWTQDMYANWALALPESKRIIRFSRALNNLPEENIKNLVEDKNGDIWAFNHKGISKYDSVRHRFATEPIHFPFSVDGSNTFKACALPDGRLVTTDRNRLIVFDPESKKISATIIPGSENISTKKPMLAVGPDGKLYFVAGGSVYRWQVSGAFELVWKVPDSFGESKEVVSFFIDSTNVLWVGTNANGVYKINLETLPLFASAYHHNFHSDVLRLLPGFSGVVPARWLNEKWSYGFRYHYTQSGALICTLGKGPEDNLNPVILKYEHGKWTTLPLPAGKFADITGLTSVGESIYAVDYAGGLWTWEKPDQLPKFVQLNKQIAMPAVIGLATDGNTLLVLTQREGIFKFRNQVLEKWYKANDPDKSTMPFIVRYFTGITPNATDKKRFWVGTMGDGLIDWHIDKGFQKVLNEKDGLPSAVIYTMTTDQDKRVWIGTNKGLSMISPDQRKVYSFQKPDGLPGDEFNRYHVFGFGDGRIAFGGVEGYVVFNPKLFSPDNSSPKTALTGLSIKNKPQLFGKSPWIALPLNELKSITLPYDQNYLSLSYAGIAFGNPGKLTYRYMLEGYDKEWNFNGNATTATYTGLPPGTYTFAVNTANTSGKWSPLIKKVIIRITPPFWATWWAYVLYVLLFLAVLRIYWKFRENQLRLRNEVIVEQAKAHHLQELNSVKTRFFDNITHELRTPLTLILTPLDRLIKQPELSPASLKNIGRIRENANRLLDAINQMLDVSKIESGKMQTNLAVGNLFEYSLQCVEAFDQEAERKGIRLEINVLQEPKLYHFDSDKWGKIIFNLLGNAIKFTPAGGTVQVLVSSRILDENTEQINLLVRDTGMGISPENLPHIFERFYMANDSGTQPGTGIGLSLVKELVELMYGQVEVSSEVDKGSEFKVTIPLTVAGSITEITADSPGKNTNEAGFKTHNTTLVNEAPLLLLVEDNEELRQFLIESLHDNWRIIAASDGKEAMQMIFEEMPDMIVSDVMMPGISGYELCEKIKSDERINHIPILLLTAKASQNSRLDGLLAGADDYLSKPFHLAELEQTITTRLSQRDRIRKHLQLEILPAVPSVQSTKPGDPFISNLYMQLDKLIYDSNADVQILADSVNLSPRSLSRKLKALLDITPGELIRRYRLQKAAVLLSQGDPVTQVAYQIGFESPSYFSQCFKEQYGITPSAFATRAQDNTI